MKVNTSRLEGLIDRRLMETTSILVIGCGGYAGAVCSLARMGISDLTLVDPDTVTDTNVATSAFTAADIGMAKVDALATAIRLINPDASVDPRVARIEDVDPGILETMFRTSNLVLSMTDNVGSATEIDRLARKHRRPVLHGAMHADNSACDLIGTLPDFPYGYTEYAAARIAANRNKPKLGTHYPSHVVSADYFNATINLVTVGLLHCLAKSNLPIARLGERFAAAPCLIMRLDPDIWAMPSHPFGEVPERHGLFASLLLSEPPC
jgi:hypothetical protein